LAIIAAEPPDDSHDIIEGTAVLTSPAMTDEGKETNEQYGKENRVVSIDK